MNLRIKYIVFVALVHIVLVILSLELLKDRLWLFLPVEALIIGSLWIAFRLYVAFIRPLNLIADGVKTIRDKDFNTKFVKAGNYEMDQLISVFNRMIDTLREERVKQREQHYFLVQLIEASPAGVLLLDFDKKITSINPAAEAILGVKSDSVQGKGLLELPGSIGRELEELEAGEFKVVRLDGIRSYKCQKSHFMDRGFRHHFIMIQEITEEILHSEKEAYEKVIRMMSHEINNSIGSVNSILNSCLTYKDYLPEADSGDYATALQAAIDRNVSLNRFMSGLADVVRIPKPMKETCDFHRLLDSVHLLLSAEIEKRGLKWEWRLSDKPFLVNLDVQQFEQVLLNILRNSIEAMGENGKITIFTATEPLKQLVIQDDGCGISPEIQQQLFNPFFSTKKNGKGVGLTLIREILMAHGFRFSLETTGEGKTEFKIVFDNHGSHTVS